VNRLEEELLVADLILKRKQVAWETPKNIAIVVGVAVALASAAAGFIGYKIGAQPPQQINITGSVQMLSPTVPVTR
jgi:hypothetical protein